MVTIAVLIFAAFTGWTLAVLMYAVNQPNQSMSDITTIPTPTPTPATTNLKALTRPILTAIAGAVLGFGGAKFAQTQKSAPEPQPAATVPARTAPPQPNIRIVSLYDCQYILVENPFTLIHLPKCTNHVAGK